MAVADPAIAPHPPHLPSAKRSDLREASRFFNGCA
jgi:hypothetical protein